MFHFSFRLRFFNLNFSFTLNFNSFFVILSCNRKWSSELWENFWNFWNKKILHKLNLIIQFKSYKYSNRQHFLCFEFIEKCLHGGFCNESLERNERTLILLLCFKNWIFVRFAFHRFNIWHINLNRCKIRQFNTQSFLSCQQKKSLISKRSQTFLYFWF